MSEQPYIEYLHCLDCGYVLWTSVENEGRTSMEFINVDGTKIIMFRAVLICPICGAKKKFYSEPISGVRIGVV